MIAILRRLIVAGVTAAITGAIAYTQVYDHPAQYVVLHHQGGVAWTNRNQAVDWFKSQKYSDIAYNAMITPDGHVWPGRDERFQSAANLGINQRAIAVCLLGNLDEHPATDAQLQAAGLWVRAALKRHPGAKLVQHKDAARIAHDPSVATGCPGAYCAKLNTARAIFLIAGGLPVAAAKAKALAELR